LETAHAVKVWGRLNRLEDLLRQHKPPQAAGWPCTASPAMGDTHPAAGAASPASALGRALGSRLVNQFLHGLFLGLASLLGWFWFYGQNSKPK